MRISPSFFLPLAILHPAFSTTRVQIVLLMRSEETGVEKESEGAEDRVGEQQLPRRASGENGTSTDLQQRAITSGSGISRAYGKLNIYSVTNSSVYLSSILRQHESISFLNSQTTSKTHWTRFQLPYDTNKRRDIVPFPSDKVNTFLDGPLLKRTADGARILVDAFRASC